MYGEKEVNKSILSVVTLASVIVLGGCSAAHTAVSKRNLDVQTQMSATVWLDPVAPNMRSVFLDIRNTSDKQLDVQQKVTASLMAKGYKIVQDPEAAHYWLQANILKVGQIDKDEQKGLLDQGYGGAIAGGVVGSQFGGGNGQIASTVVGAGLGILADAMVKDVVYTMVTDLQISERAKKGVAVNEANNQVLAQGTSGAKTQTSNEVTDRKKYQTRVVSTATKVNLEFVEAQPALEDGLAKSIAGIL